MLNNNIVPAKGGSASGGKLLMITRKVDKNDALAGFAWNWVRKIGSNLDRLYIISWQNGDRGDLPENIEVKFLSVGKLKKVLILWIELIKIMPKVDGLFCHMNPEYTILAAPVAKIFGKKTVSWYTHKQVNWKRRLVELLANKIITASPESFRHPWFAKKVTVIGHGIDTNQFAFNNSRLKNHDDFNIISVGRISPTKDYESIIKTVSILNDSKIHPVKSGEAGSPAVKFNRVKLKIIGDVILEFQRQYLEDLKKMVIALDLSDQVEFSGWIANKDMPPHYQQADLFINMSGTGSVDKVVLEAMSCGCLVLTSNEAFARILPSELMVEKNNPEQLAEKIKRLMALSETERAAMRKDLRRIVVENHNLDNLAKKIINQFI